MTPKIFKTTLAEYVKAQWTGKNSSGWEAFADHVIVQPDEVASKTKGGVELPEEIQDRMTMAAEAGVVVSVGDTAFKYTATGMPFQGRAPSVGERVSIGRYSGQQLMGHDGVRYRILSCSEIGAIEDAPAPGKVN